MPARLPLTFTEPVAPPSARCIGRLGFVVSAAKAGGQMAPRHHRDVSVANCTLTCRVRRRASYAAAATMQSLSCRKVPIIIGAQQSSRDQMRCGTHLEASWAAAAAVPWSQFISALCVFGSADSSAVAYSLYVGSIMVEFGRGDPLAMSPQGGVPTCLWMKLPFERRLTNGKAAGGSVFQPMASLDRTLIGQKAPRRFAAA